MKIELISKEKVLDLVKSIMDDSPTSYSDLAKLQTDLFLMKPEVTLNKTENVEEVRNNSVILKDFMKKARR